MNDLLYFFDTFLDHYLGDDPLHDLNHLYNLLDYPRNHHDPFYDLLNLDHLRHLDHLLDDLLNRHFHLFDAVDMPQHLNDLLLDIFDGLGDFDVVIYDLLDLHDLDLSDYDGFSDLHDDWHLAFYGLDHWLLDDFLHPNDALVDDWNLDDPLHLFGDFSDHLNYSFHDLLDLFDDLSLNYFLPDDLDLNGHLNSIGHLHDLLDDLRYLYDPLLSLDDDHWFLDDPIDDHMSDLNMILYLFSGHDLHFLHDLLHYPLHLDDLWHSDDLLNDLLNKHWNLHQPLNDLLHMDDLFFDDLNLTDLDGYVVDHLANRDHLLHLDDLLDVFLYYLDLWDFFDDLDDAVYNGWHLDCLLDDPLNVDDLLVDGWNDHRHLDRHWDVLLHLSDLLNFNDLLDDLLDHYDLRHFDDPINDLLHYFLHLDDLRRHSEHLQNIINVDYAHDLLIDKSDDPLIDL